MEVGTVKQKRRNIKVMYSQDGVSLSHEESKTRLVITRTSRQTAGPPLTTYLEAKACEYKRKQVFCTREF